MSPLAGFLTDDTYLCPLLCVCVCAHMYNRMPQRKHMFEEGKGFEPDYWLDTTEPLEEIKNWLKNKV